MTKRWSSTRRDPSVTKRAASKPARVEDSRSVLAALQVMLMAWDCKTSVDGRRYIGLGDDCMFPLMPGPIQSVEDARRVLAVELAKRAVRLEDDPDAED